MMRPPARPCGGQRMIFIWGSRLYGRVDEVPGLFHVATRFGHLWYIPLIPMGSTVIFEKSGNSYRGVPIGLSAKSFLVAWLRAGLIVAAVLLGIFGLSGIGDPRSQVIAWSMVGAAVACIV